MFIALLFDFFRILRKSFKTPDWLTYLEDVIFWIITCITLAFSIFKFNNGEFRFYIVIGLCIGFTIYLLCFSKYIVKFSVKCISIIKKVVSAIYNVIKYPINIIISILKKFFGKSISFIFINVRRILINIMAKNEKILKKRHNNGRI